MATLLGNVYWVSPLSLNSVALRKPDLARFGICVYRGCRVEFPPGRLRAVPFTTVTKWKEHASIRYKCVSKRTLSRTMLAHSPHDRCTRMD